MKETLLLVFKLFHQSELKTTHFLSCVMHTKVITNIKFKCMFIEILYKILCEEKQIS